MFGCARRFAAAALVTLLVAFGPYLVFDLLFQETITTRYALPLVIPVRLRLRDGEVCLFSTLTTLGTPADVTAENAAALAAAAGQLLAAIALRLPATPGSAPRAALDPARLPAPTA